ncbi:MAG: phosphotransferase [Anaerolineae bacterium]|nr:phosphotransferase [Anaerolineae bacterium]
MIPGQPLTTDRLERLSPQARDRLIVDLARFFHDTHSIPQGEACEWLGIRFDGERTAARLAETRGKPTWFSPDAVAEMRPALMPLLDHRQRTRFEDTVRRFEALETDPDNMVFGHGDLHGYNMALEEDSLGLKLAGVFDLGCAGILDIHEDFFRLSLISEDLLEQVIETYQGLSRRKRTLRRDRIAIYYRAFLFHLMAGKSGQGLRHLQALLGRHLAYKASHGPFG